MRQLSIRFLVSILCVVLGLSTAAIANAARTHDGSGALGPETALQQSSTPVPTPSSGESEQEEEEEEPDCD